ncbi:MAG: serine/threonine-protein kinase, partial [Deltaproteobacteria bacterium]|nr:serine/threonine-protein kinase [Deltaproteobacteria bacterium]
MSKQSGVQLLDGFKIIKPLGQGAFGEVLLAEDAKKRPVALKFLKIEAGPQRGEQEKFIDRFKQEFALLAELRHRNLARVFDFGFDPAGKRYFFTQEFCAGKNFLETLDGKPLASFEEALVQILSALDYIHSLGVVHFDIKAENVIVGEENGKPEVKLLDFGIAARIQAMPANFGGTPRYMAPEVLAR